LMVFEILTAKILVESPQSKENDRRKTRTGRTRTRGADITFKETSTQSSSLWRRATHGMSHTTIHTSISVMNASFCAVHNRQHRRHEGDSAEQGLEERRLSLIAPKMVESCARPSLVCRVVYQTCGSSPLVEMCSNSGLSEG